MEELRRYKGAFERQFYKLVCRDVWEGGNLPVESRPLKTPLRGLILSYTEQKRCKTKDECIERVREVQQLARKEGKPDTQLNFLVGGDGYVYECMGWHHYLPEHVKMIKGGERLYGRSIEVAFIDKNSNAPTDGMQRGLSRVVTMGLTEKFLVENFTFHCRNNSDVQFLYGRDEAKEKRRVMQEKRRQRRDPNYKQEKPERMKIDMDQIKEDLRKQGVKVPDKVFW
ncbi:peptidoglycan recognition protein 1-like [Macrosteles quadrilineatus]|uniref:peptidoglycan recognition protein 1-like n=1 Tax=Macrosteles quadrilineatus TaxID=74068 RepID=UPI0023E1A70F|nr:peptidoglycan recognition protein 1-like [Macrosteles quadrilineatus]XP_054284778.1 peptidoglycan recognition protein 1-like [Macrosteles quadrilineatus]